jgi:MoaA/NifB/PqqE/SkfB family radical SAM enzyme
MYSIKDIKHLHIEFSSLCNARCPLCPRNLCGVPYNGGYCETNLSLDTVKLLPVGVIANLGKILVNGNFGDFTSNLESLDIIAYIRNINPSTRIEISTNGSARNEDFWKQLASYDVQVDFCLDGMKDTHHLYRQDTDWDKIINNAKTFMNAGGKAIWKMIRFDHNVHQIDECKKLSETLGFISFELIDHGRDTGPVFDRNGNLSHTIGNFTQSVDLEFKKNQVDFKFPAKPQSVNCFAKKWSSFYISAEGKVYPCCFLGFSPDTYNMGWTGWANRNFKHLIANNSLHHNTLEECIEWFNKIPNAWEQDSYDSGRIIHCDQACGKR